MWDRRGRGCASADCRISRIATALWLPAPVSNLYTNTCLGCPSGYRFLTVFSVRVRHSGLAVEEAGQDPSMCCRGVLSPSQQGSNHIALRSAAHGIVLFYSPMKPQSLLPQGAMCKPIGAAEEDRNRCPGPCRSSSLAARCRPHLAIPPSIPNPFCPWKTRRTKCRLPGGAYARPRGPGPAENSQSRSRNVLLVSVTKRPQPWPPVSVYASKSSVDFPLNEKDNP